jgi:hypothetical protein
MNSSRRELTLQTKLPIGGGEIALRNSKRGAGFIAHEVADSHAVRCQPRNLFYRRVMRELVTVGDRVVGGTVGQHHHGYAPITAHDRHGKTAMNGGELLGSNLLAPEVVIVDVGISYFGMLLPVWHR